MIWGWFKEPCTLWPNRVWRFNWRHCCKNHDTGYGNFTLDYDRFAYRLMHDEELRKCVNKVLPGMGWVMWFGVRIAGDFVMRAHDKERG